MSNYNFLKTGSSNLREDVDDEALAFQKNITAILVKFTANALQRAGKYVEHTGRNVITTDDIQLCMKHECFQFMQTPSSEVQDTFDYLFKEEEDEEYDYEEEEMDNEEDEKEEPFERSTCTCEECTAIHRSEEQFLNWFPDHIIYKTLKIHIENLSK